MSGRLLLVDDDRFILNALARLLGAQGYHCTMAASGASAIQLLESEPFDLVLLDVNLPDVDGMSICRRLRSSHHLPVIMVTARDSAVDNVTGLECGADDYLTKPFEAAEVLARVRAQLRRARDYSLVEGKNDQIVAGNLLVDLSAHEAFVNGRAAHLTAKEFELLSVLARNLGKAMPRDFLFEQVWGYDAELGVKALAVCVRRLRMKIETDPDKPVRLSTVRGYGYKLA
jgi:DNA-binding response OmpR family regulator